MKTKKKYKFFYFMRDKFVIMEGTKRYIINRLKRMLSVNWNDYFEAYKEEDILSENQIKDFFTDEEYAETTNSNCPHNKISYCEDCKKIFFELIQNKIKEIKNH